MCTSIVVNRKKMIRGFNLDLMDMTWRIRQADEGVFIEIDDPKEGWMPLFGANVRGDFSGIPTCWPYDKRSDPRPDSVHVIDLDIDFLLMNRTLEEIRHVADRSDICSIPGVTFMASMSDAEGNVLHIVPGQGAKYYEKPDHAVMTNFSPFKMDKEIHPWMGWDRYRKAEEVLNERNDDFGVENCFALLKEVSQEVCPTVVSMVYDAGEKIVYWCEERRWNELHRIEL